MFDAPPIPQASPAAAYDARRDAIDLAIRRVLDSGRYILGEEVAAFEKEFANALGAGEGTAVGVASGTDAIELALRALDIGLGKAVLAPSHTAVATVVAIERSGARPVLVDVDPLTFTLDAAGVDALLQTRHDFEGCRAAAILPVHLYGQPADMRGVLHVAKKYGLAVIEDCAQSHGARFAGRRTGTFGDAAAFSFYPTKNLGAIGDGGLVVARDRKVADRVRALREYGWNERRVSLAPGMNSRLDELQAAILRIKLVALDADNRRRIEIARRYADGLSRLGLGVPVCAKDAEHVFHQFVLRVPEGRDELRSLLESRKIATAVHYPVPVHCQPAYENRGLAVGPLPQTEKLCREIVSLPMFPQLTDEQVERVIAAIQEWAARRDASEGSPT